MKGSERKTCPCPPRAHNGRLASVNLYGLVAGILIGLFLFPWFGLTGLFFTSVVGLLSETGVRNRSSGARDQELVARLFALWGKIAAHGGGLNQMQSLFLQGVMVNQLQLRGTMARQALATLNESYQTSMGRPWTEVATDVTDLAREIHEDFFLNRQTLIWVYATCRRLAALGSIRPGIVEMLDTVARGFGIFDEVGSAGIEGAQRNEGSQYEQAWQNFHPGASAGPEAFATLGLKPEATTDEVKKAYRTLVRQYHPDSHSHLPDGHPDKKKASERFLQVQQAYERIRKARKF